MKILVFNSGSSSLKYQIIDTREDKCLLKGLVEKIGMLDSAIKQTRHDGDTITINKEIISHTKAIAQIQKLIVDKKHGVLMSITEIDAVGHRVVHGGEKYSKSVLIDDEVIDAIEKYSEIAPLHNPYNLKGITAAQKVLPDVPQIAVFDTAFHHTLPPEAYIFPIPYTFYEKHKIRKYGFHGTSHFFVSQKAAEMLKRDINDFNVITCHLGNGASITAVKNGKSIDTTLGFSTIAGIMMGTRSGNFDPDVILKIMDKEDLTIDQAESMLTKHSGLLGVSGISSDMREITKAAENHNERAMLAINMFCYKIKKQIAAYAGALGSVDAIVFTAGIGENVQHVREKCCRGLEFMDAHIDKEKNDACASQQMDISTDQSGVRILVIPTNEELVIAMDVEKIVTNM
ncbi:MAG: acetate kinase [candidate division WOR-3 bacterium]|nr:acetate kinase [candidate division WOR-3 bacterium]